MAGQITITRDDITLTVALVGVALGIFNFTRDWWRNKIRLRVVPKLSGTNKLGHGLVWDNANEEFYKKQNFVGEPRLCIEVQNTGSRAVSVEYVAFGVRWKRWKGRLPVRNPDLSAGFKSFPVRLEPHASVVAYTDMTPEDVWRTFGPLRLRDC
jgi:hypothetical protein